MTRNKALSMSAKTFHDRDGYIWMDGRMLPWRTANVHILTHALHYATSVFEGERAYDGRIFRSLDHSRRLVNSARILRMDVPFSAEEIEAAKAEVLEANGQKNSYVRAIVWRGSEMMGIRVRGTKIHMAVACWDDWVSYFDPELRASGILLCTSRWRKPSPDTAPTESKCGAVYAVSTIAKGEAEEAGFTDALMLDYEGYVAESTGANFFAVRDGALITPIADRFLNGLTRQSIMALAPGLGIRVEERRIRPEELKEFSEVFLTGTAAEITPVRRIDSLDFEVGPATLTSRLHHAYEDLVRMENPKVLLKAANS
jgi:branched-chain amino acid aminotransferase